MINIRFVRNFASLGTMQIINYILPILLTPFLVSTIGIYNVGIIATAMAIAAYIQLFIDYGFNLTATREIAKDGYNDNSASKITSAVFNIKIIFSILSTILVFLLIALVPFLRENIKTLIFTFLLIITQSFFPVWHFQGSERMHYTGLCNSLPKICSAICILFLIKDPSDTWKVQLISFFGALLSLFISILILIFKFNYRYSFSPTEIKEQLKEGYSIFVARIASGLYKNFNILILGYFSTPSAVGIYSISEKILRSLQMVQNVAGDALYPIFSKKSKDSIFFFKEQVKKYNLALISAYFLFSMAIFIFSDLISSLIANSAKDGVSTSLRIMSMAFFFGGLNYIYAILGLTSCGYSKYFSRCVIITGIFNVIAASFLSYKFSFIGASFALVFSEAFLLTMVLIYSKKSGIL